MALQAIFVPIQGFLNAIVYGWTRGDFLGIMSSQRVVRGRANSFTLSHDDTHDEKEEVEDDGEEWECGSTHRKDNSILYLSVSQEVVPGGSD